MYIGPRFDILMQFFFLLSPLSLSQKDLIILKDVHRVFAVDALASSHPLSSKEEDIIKPEQITEQFDTVSYSKVPDAWKTQFWSNVTLIITSSLLTLHLFSGNLQGASVLRMLSDFLTEPVFVQGLNVGKLQSIYDNQINMFCFVFNLLYFWYFSP